MRMMVSMWDGDSIIIAYGPSGQVTNYIVCVTSKRVSIHLRPTWEL